MSDCLRCPVCSCAHLLVHIAHETAGAARIRHSLRPLIGEGVSYPAKLARNARQDREGMSVPFGKLRWKLYAPFPHPRRPGLEPVPIRRGLSTRALALDTF